MRRRVLFVLPKLVAGGSEKVLRTVASNLDRGRFEVHLAVLGDSTIDDRACLAPHIQIHKLAALRVRFAGIKLLRLVWKLRPQVVLAAGGPTGVVAASIRKFLPSGTRVILRQGTMPAASVVHQKQWERYAFAWSQRSVDCVICQSNSMADEVTRGAPVKRERVRVIYNPVVRGKNANAGRSDREDKLRFLAVGRLAPEKRLELVIRAFAILKRKHSNATLTIVGDGPCRDWLEELATVEGISAAVEFTGFQEDPTAWMLHSTALVMASEYEGLPNAVLEALAIGLPVVACDCPGGIREIAETTTRLTLVEEATPAALARAMEETALRSAMQESPSDAFWQRFGMESTLKQYEQLLS